MISTPWPRTPSQRPLSPAKLIPLAFLFFLSLCELHLFRHGGAFVVFSPRGVTSCGVSVSHFASRPVIFAQKLPRGRLMPHRHEPSRRRRPGNGDFFGSCRKRSPQLKSHCLIRRCCCASLSTDGRGAEHPPRPHHHHCCPLMAAQ